MNFEESFKDCLYYTTSGLYREVTVLAEESFAPLGLTPSYAYLLMIVYQFKEIPTADTARKIGLKPSTVTRLADKMVARGYIVRKSKGRTSLLVKTEKLDDEVGKIFACWKKLNLKYKEILGEKQLDRLNKLMITSKNKL